LIGIKDDSFAEAEQRLSVKEILNEGQQQSDG
jgi:hypothetical protein